MRVCGASFLPFMMRGGDAEIIDAATGAGAEDRLVDADRREFARRCARSRDRGEPRPAARSSDTSRSTIRPQSASESVVSAVHFTLGRALRHPARGDLVGLDVSGLRTEIDDHVAEHEPLGHRHSRDQRAREFDAEIGRRILAVELRDPQRDVLGVDARPKVAVQIEADDLRHLQPVVAEREIGGDVRMSHAGRDAAERAVGDGVRIGAEDERARKRIALLRKDDVPDAFTGVKFGDALFLDPFARLLLRDRILLANRRIMMIEDDDDLRRIEDLVAAHLAQQIGGAGRAAIVEHHEVRNDVDDLADLDALAVGVPGNDFRNGVHRSAFS